MPFFINRKDNRQIETIDEFNSSKEAYAMVCEYNLSDPFAQYYVAKHACKAWRESNR